METTIVTPETINMNNEVDNTDDISTATSVVEAEVLEYTDTEDEDEDYEDEDEDYEDEDYEDDYYIEFDNTNNDNTLVVQELKTIVTTMKCIVTLFYIMLVFDMFRLYMTLVKTNRTITW